MVGGASLLISLLACAPDRAPAQVLDGPGPRFGHEMVYDVARDVTLLFGGFGPDGVPKGDTWLWDGSDWQLAAETGPSPRKWAAAAYDSRRQVVVLHGGREGVGRSGPSLDDTWIWDGRAWTEVQAEGPTWRDHHRAVYDSGRDRVVLFGGWGGAGLLGDTWEWDGTKWERVATNGPSPRAPFGLVYHEGWGAVVLAGGQQVNGAFDDAWTWDGERWTEHDRATPTARGFHAMVYSPEADAILLFGGRDGETLFRGLWMWDDTGWSLVSSEGPEFRGIYASSYDRPRGQLVIHGGGNLIGGVWQLDSRTWTWAPGSGWQVVSGVPPV